MQATTQESGIYHRAHNTHVLPGMSEKQARRARMLDVPTVIVVLLVIPALILHFSEVGGWLATLSNVLNWLIYGWFAFEFSTRSTSLRTKRNTSGATSYISSCW